MTLISLLSLLQEILASCSRAGFSSPGSSERESLGFLPLLARFQTCPSLLLEVLPFVPPR